jgi:hypothetical protein
MAQAKILNYIWVSEISIFNKSNVFTLKLEILTIKIKYL